MRGRVVGVVVPQAGSARSPSSARVDTASRPAARRASDRNAPPPSVAHQRASSIGRVITPTTISPSTSSATCVPQCRCPRTRLNVPSIGIEDPPARAVAVETRLLAQDRVVGPRGPQPVDQHAVDGEIHVGDRRAVAPSSRCGRRSRAPPGRCVGAGGELERQREVGGEVGRCAHRAASWPTERVGSGEIAEAGDVDPERGDDRRDPRQPRRGRLAVRVDDGRRPTPRSPRPSPDR